MAWSDLAYMGLGSKDEVEDCEVVEKKCVGSMIHFCVCSFYGPTRAESNTDCPCGYLFVGVDTLVYAGTEHS